MKILTKAAAVAVAALGCAANAQDHDMHNMPGMEGMDHSKHAMPESTPDEHAGHGKQARWVSGSGTARLPGNEDSMTGLHIPAGDWMVMAHGYAWGVYSDQGGPRGDKMGVVQSMGMLEASGPVGNGVRLQLRSMLSLDPLMGDRGYPNLFATGETAGGEALVDRQHPHDFFMELSARLDVDVAEDTNLFLYGGPVAEPALGPSAFMHRRSSRYNPEAPISHHWFDSTHITFSVATAGISARQFQLETSAFRGREPDEKRWDIETQKFDSWSVRASWTPSPRWAAQVSYGRLNSPEALHQGDDEGRLTASVNYADPKLAITGAWSRKDRLPGPVLNAWLAEANYTLAERHNLFGRVEVVENDELFDHDSPLHEQAFRVGKFTGGYAYRLPLGDIVNLAIGGSASLYAVPDRIQFAYGKSPKSFTLFAKLSLGD
jgi:hypothetical protein